MNVLILAAGYATRLYPLTLNKAKPLLEVAGKPMIERITDQLAAASGIETVYVVTNAKFANQFEEWAEKLRQSGKSFQLEIVNDGSTSDDDKLGAIGDIHLVLKKPGLANNDLLVIAGDNLFTEPLDGFVDFARDKPAAVAIYDVGDREQMKKYASVTLDAQGVITYFEEKPPNPQGTLAALALYFYSRDVLPLVATYLEEGNNADQPGRFLQWLYTRRPIHTFQIQGKWLDIGSKETLEAADRLFPTRRGTLRPRGLAWNSTLHCRKRGGRSSATPRPTPYAEWDEAELVPPFTVGRGGSHPQLREIAGFKKLSG